MVSAIKYRWAHVPKVVKGVAGTLAAVGTLVGASAVLSAYAALPARVEAIETWRQDTIGPAIKYGACNDWQRNHGLDPKACDFIVKDLGDFLPKKP
jgi:hypothetical protein